MNSENSNGCPIVVRNFCPADGELPRCGISAFLQLFSEFLVQAPEKLPSLLGRKFRLFVLCSQKLLSTCLKAPALTRYVGEAEVMGEHIGQFLSSFPKRQWHLVDPNSFNLAITAFGGRESSFSPAITVFKALKVISLKCYRRPGKTD